MQLIAIAIVGMFLFVSCAVIVHYKPDGEEWKGVEE